MKHPNTLRAMRTSQRGLTLVELMVALTLGLLVTLAAASIYLVARQGFRTSSDQSRSFESGRTAVDTISRSLRMAGMPPFDHLSPPMAPSQIAFSGNAIFGEEGAETDVISVAYTNLDPYDAATLLGANCSGAAVKAGDQTINTFFITANKELACFGTSAVSGTGASAASITAAKDVSAVVTPVASGVVDMQILYGVASAPEVGSVSKLVDASNVTNWSTVRAIDVCIDVISLENNVVAGKTPGLNCKGEDFKDDGKHHRLYRFTVNRRNDTRGNILSNMP
jgi:type IV pilus assembly protein PilW